MKKENSNEDFNQIYEGNENNYVVNDKLEKNTNYEIKLCSVYKGINSHWTEIHKIKTKDFDIDSNILSEQEKGNEYLQKLYEWTGYKKMELLYRGTRDGDGSNIFHDKCNNQGPTIFLCKNEKGNIFGGYSSISWTSDGGWHLSYDNFLCTLTNIHGTAPTKFPITRNYGYAIYDYSSYGPTFGGNHDIKIDNNYLNNNGSYCNLGYSYTDSLGHGNSIFSGDVNSNNFKLKEMEVFKLLN